MPIFQETKQEMTCVYQCICMHLDFTTATRIFCQIRLLTQHERCKGNKEETSSQ